MSKTNSSKQSYRRRPNIGASGDLYFCIYGNESENERNNFGRRKAQTLFTRN